MNSNKVVIPIIIGVIIVIAGIVVVSQESNTIEVENAFDKELTPTEEITQEIQEKLDEIEKIKSENEYSPKEREWITSGPFQIDRTEYALGEKIFVRMGGIGSEEKGEIALFRPLNNTHHTVFHTIPFDGANKPAFNYYLEPKLSKPEGICTVNDLLGDWKVVFRGTDYPMLDFKVVEKYVPGLEASFEPVC